MALFYIFASLFNMWLNRRKKEKKKLVETKQDNATNHKT